VLLDRITMLQRKIADENIAEKRAGNDAGLYVQRCIGKASPESTPREASPRSMEIEAWAEKD